MSWSSDRYPFVLAVVVYGVSMIYSVILWRNGFRRDSRVNYFLLLVAFGFHSAAMMLRGFRFDRCPVSNLYEATMFAMWAIVALYLGVGLWTRLRFLGAFASPVLFAMGVFALMPGLDGSHNPVPEVPLAWTSAHAALMSLSYGAFGLSAVAALMFLTQEHNLKLHKLRAIFSLMPPIERLEVAAERLLLGGFVLLTAGLAVGVVGLAFLNNAQTYRGDPKIVWSLAVWLLYLSLIIMRWKFAQTGRRFALSDVGTFAFVLLTFWVTNILSPLHHH